MPDETRDALIIRSMRTLALYRSYGDGGAQKRQDTRTRRFITRAGTNRIVVNCPCATKITAPFRPLAGGRLEELDRLTGGVVKSRRCFHFFLGSASAAPPAAVTR